MMCTVSYAIRTDRTSLKIKTTSEKLELMLIIVQSLTNIIIYLNNKKFPSLQIIRANRIKINLIKQRSEFN